MNGRTGLPAVARKREGGRTERLRPERGAKPPSESEWGWGPTSTKRGREDGLAHRGAKPWELAGRHEGKPLVVRLEDLTALVELVAPGRLIVRNPRVQHEVVAPPGDRDRVELDGAEPSEDLEDGLRTSLHGPSRREELPGDEEPASFLRGDFHGADASAQPERSAGLRIRFDVNR